MVARRSALALVAVAALPWSARNPGYQHLRNASRGETSVACSTPVPASSLLVGWLVGWSVGALSGRDECVENRIIDSPHLQDTNPAMDVRRWLSPIGGDLRWWRTMFNLSGKAWLQGDPFDLRMLAILLPSGDARVAMDDDGYFSHPRNWMSAPLFITSGESHPLCWLKSMAWNDCITLAISPSALADSTS